FRSFLAGLLPVVVALGVRLFLRESAHWTASDARTRPSTPRELFGPGMRAATLSGVFAAVIAVLAWWACNAFIPLLGRTLAAEDAASAGLLPAAARQLAASWQAHASNAFNLGRLLGAFPPPRAARAAHSCASCAGWRWCRSARRSSRASCSWRPAAARCPCEAARSTHPGVYDRGRTTARTPLAAPRKVSTPMAQLTLIIG